LKGANNIAFSVNLPSGRFLIIGVEVRRGGDAINEDAISFRAYKEEADRFALIADDGNLHRSDPSNPYLMSLHAKQLPFPPVTGEFWFVTSAVVPPQSPYSVVMRLYAFDGETFRTVWAPDDILATSEDKAIDVTATGFIVNRLFDSSGHAPHSPDVRFTSSSSSQ
jgi:hypothetical protein